MTKRRKNTKRISSRQASPEKTAKTAKPAVVIIAAVVVFFIAAGYYALTLRSELSPIVDIRIGDCLVRAEIADTPQLQEKGLGNRKRLKANHGMLFVFGFSQTLNFWMKDTAIPLSIAFISSDGTILQIEQMAPFDLHLVKSDSPARYALEVNRGFFEENGITVGAQVDLTNVINR